MENRHIFSSEYDTDWIKKESIPLGNIFLDEPEHQFVKIPLSLSNEELAKRAARKATPHVYHLTNYAHPIKFMVIGCQGSGKPSQEEVARLANNVALSERDNRPAFILFLGDNLYNYGASSPSDAGFENYFYKMYGSKNCPALHTIPCFVLIGNHDGNLHKSSGLSHNPPGKETELNQVAHSYLPDTNYETVSEKKTLYRSHDLNLKTLPTWNMPSLFYSLIIGDIQIFCLNSNSYAKDYLDSLHPRSTSEVNQAIWFKQAYEKARAEGKKIILAQHHPLYTAGKRAFPDDYDTKLYISENDLYRLQQALSTTTESYNQLLSHILEKQGITPDLILVAHDHCMSYYNNQLNATEKESGMTQMMPIIKQVTAGGGGQTLQARESLLGHPFVACYEKNNGLTVITDIPHVNSSIKTPLPSPKFMIDIHTTTQVHLKFTDRDRYALINAIKDPHLKNFRYAVLKQCYDYLSLLKQEEKKQLDLMTPPIELISKKPPPLSQAYEQSGMVSALYTTFSIFKSGASLGLKKFKQYLYHDANKAREMVLIHDLIAYFNQPTIPDLYRSMEFVYDRFNELPDKNSLFYNNLKMIVMNKEGLWNNYQFNLDELISNKKLLA